MPSATPPKPPKPPKPSKPSKPPSSTFIFKSFSSYSSFEPNKTYSKTVTLESTDGKQFKGKIVENKNGKTTTKPIKLSSSVKGSLKSKVKDEIIKMK